MGRAEDVTEDLKATIFKDDAKWTEVKLIGSPYCKCDVISGWSLTEKKNIFWELEDGDKWKTKTR